jgi:pyrimidine-nucleoside phosphorylase
MLEPWFRRALERKRDGGALDGPTWDRIVARYVDGSVEETAIAALLMAIAIRGLDAEETFFLTDAMIRSGDVLSFGDVVVVDKHSSGGVADSVSLLVVPLVAACGVRVAKLSGHALGHTGGTLDKLEAIPGLRTDLSPEAFRAQVERVGCAIAAQSDRLVPADRKLYALRDRTATIQSLGLIAASIVSKKIAGGAGAIVFDVKAGAGAFVRDEAEGRELAARMVELAGRFKRRASALVTGMEEPLGTAIGTALEVIEARDFLRGERRDPRLWAVTELVATEMLRVAGVDENDAPGRLRDGLASGSAYASFVALVEAQGGSRAALEGLAPARLRTPVVAPRAGTVAAIDAVSLGDAARALVETRGSDAGIVVRRRIGETVAAGEPLAEIVGADGDAVALAAAFSLVDRPVAPSPLLLACVRDTLGTVPSKRFVS